MADTTIEQARLDVATEANYEIGVLAEMLKKYIDQTDACGEIRPAARGVLLRIGKLTDIICGAVAPIENLDPLDELQMALQRG